MTKRITELTSATVLAETDLLPVVDTSDTTQATSGTTKKSALSLIADYIADYIKARVETITNKTLSTGSVVDANVNVVEVLKKAYPIGSVYINASNATNPASLLGFGTWSAFGAGKVMVGLDAGDTSFDTLGGTGGEKTHTLSVAEMPSHSHSKTVIPRDTQWVAPTGGWNYSYTDGATYTQYTDDTGGGGAHNNLQPYIVVYFWKRTA